MISIEHYIVLSALIFLMGGVGFLVRSNVLVTLMSIEVMLNACNLALVAFNRSSLNVAGPTKPLPVGSHTGQFSLSSSSPTEAAEVAVGLAIVLVFYRLRRPFGPTTPTIEKLRSGAERLLSLFPENDFALIAVILGMPLLGAFVNGVWGRGSESRREADGPLGGGR